MKFAFVVSIPETMFHYVLVASKILEEYKKFPYLGARTITHEMRLPIDEADKVKKAGKEDSPIPNEEVHNEDFRNEDEILHNKENISNPEITQPFNDSVPSPHPSPKTTSIPITITPWPLVSTQQQTSIPLSIPLFTDSIVPSTTSAPPFVSVNVSDTGANTLGMLSDILETRDSMLTITVRKHLLEKVWPIFAILDRLEGVLESDFILKQGGEGASKQFDPKIPRKEPKVAAKHVSPIQPIVKKESKSKEKLFSEEPIIDNEEEEEDLDEEELKRQKAHEAELDEYQRIIREAEEKERVEKVSQGTLQTNKLLFPEWTMKRI
ncbi:unnamed protein product [Lactuca saligna]|uniref:Uncharacterized protein n=1 Tax=Lactuca saligna TaxID=75948 RepID=A0AA35UZI2_LACSI|nr:unnamed protein product [Lactuca saligna]